MFLSPWQPSRGHAWYVFGELYGSGDCVRSDHLCCKRLFGRHDDATDHGDTQVGGNWMNTAVLTVLHEFSTSVWEKNSFWLTSKRTHRHGISLKIMGELPAFNSKNLGFSIKSDVQQLVQLTHESHGKYYVKLQVFLSCFLAYSSVFCNSRTICLLTGQNEALTAHRMRTRQQTRKRSWIEYIPQLSS